MKNKVLLCIALLGISCQPKNVDFNPFDNDFRFHKTFNISDYDTIFGECGYWDLTKSSDSIKTYYQFYLDENKAVAKGFIIVIDEIPISNYDSLKSDKNISKQLESHPIDFEIIKQRLAQFKIKDIKILNDANGIVSVDLIDINDSINSASIITEFDNNKIMRYLQYCNVKHDK